MNMSLKVATSNKLELNKKYHAESISFLEADFTVLRKIDGDFVVEVKGDLDYLLNARKLESGD